MTSRKPKVRAEPLSEKQIERARLLKLDFADAGRHAKASDHAYNLAGPAIRWPIRWLNRNTVRRVLRPEITKRQYRAMKRANRHDRGALANLREWARPSAVAP